MKVAWTRAIRFVSSDDKVLYGEPILSKADYDLGKWTGDVELKAKVITGEDLFDTTGITRVSDEVVTVKKLLGPLTKNDVPILRCVGLNYAKHSTRSTKSSQIAYADATTQSRRQEEVRLHSRPFSSSRILPCSIMERLSSFRR